MINEVDIEKYIESTKKIYTTFSSLRQRADELQKQKEDKINYNIQLQEQLNEAKKELNSLQEESKDLQKSLQSNKTQNEITEPSAIPRQDKPIQEAALKIEPSDKNDRDPQTLNEPTQILDVDDETNAKKHPCIRVYGKCTFGEHCHYSNLPYEACLRYLKGRCEKGSTCTDIHIDSNRDFPGFKLKLCTYYADNQSCPHSDKCSYAHGEEEHKYYTESHRSKMNTENPNYKKDLCKHFEAGTMLGSDGCSYGDQCKYAHGDAERVQDSKFKAVNSGINTNLTNNYFPLSPAFGDVWKWNTGIIGGWN